MSNTEGFRNTHERPGATEGGERVEADASREATRGGTEGWARGALDNRSRIRTVARDDGFGDLLK